MRSQETFAQPSQGNLFFERNSSDSWGKAVTSLNVELGLEKVDEAEVKAKILKHFAQLFEAEFVTK